jgi:hypothetical protein
MQTKLRIGDKVYHIAKGPFNLGVIEDFRYDGNHACVRWNDGNDIHPIKNLRFVSSGILCSICLECTSSESDYLCKSCRASNYAK